MMRAGTPGGLRRNEDGEVVLFFVEWMGGRRIKTRVEERGLYIIGGSRRGEGMERPEIGRT